MLKVLASPMWMLLKGVYEIIWVFAPILTLVLVFIIGILVTVRLEREISIELVNTYSQIPSLLLLREKNFTTRRFSTSTWPQKRKTRCIHVMHET